MHEFFELITNKHVKTVMRESAYKKHISKYDTMNAVFEYIDTQYDKDISVSSLAERFFMSPSYFAHLFKKRCGKSITEYINDVRITHAKALIDKGGESIGRIASRVGFSDINYFSRKFKAIVGITPSEYKKSFQ